MEGNFELRVSCPQQTPIQLVFSYIGYHHEEKTIDLKEGTQVELGRIQLQANIVHSLTGGTIVTAYTRNPIKRLWWKIKRVF